jgi:SpoVK/Ycf46/Vps4 family AAA+-type ATPase
LPVELPEIRLRGLESRDRAALWTEILGPRTASDAAAIEAVAEHFQLGPSEIVRIATQQRPDGTASLWTACREFAARGLGDLAQRIEPRYRWDDIVLPAGVRAELEAIVAQVRYRAGVYGRWGFAERLHRGRGVSALFAGPSGVGKTMAAEVIAQELRLDLYSIDLSGVVSKYIGETEKNLRRIFEAAAAAGAVLFFDEADALFGKRTEVKDSHDRYANIEVSYLLQRMESYPGLAILATNLKNNLDHAFFRRLRFVVDFPFPDVAQRREIWARIFPGQTPTDRLDLGALARLEIAGGNIVVIAVNAAFLAAAEDRPVGMDHITRAARSEFRKLDREFRPPWQEGR